MGQPKEKRENQWISRGSNRGQAAQPDEKKEKTNRLVGPKNRRPGGPTLGKKEKTMDKKGLKTGTG